MHEPVFVFAGPSLFGTGIQAHSPARSSSDQSISAHASGGAQSIQWLPPARRGDIEALITRHPTPGVIGLADGTFHAYPSVSHFELREAIQAGWVVYGLCSMGAIRACEMVHLGMRPWGRVAALFCAEPDFPDDEVALLHGTDAPFIPLTEPMVHIREFLRCMERRGLLSLDAVQQIIGVLTSQWYGERTLHALRALVKSIDVCEAARADVEAAMMNFKPYRLKQKDLLSFVSDKPWLKTDPHSPLAAAT